MALKINTESMRYKLFLLLLVLCTFGIKAQPIVELGDVAWLRNLEEAKAKAAELDKPIFVLFQEVPGCQTCQRFGQQVLKNPLLVEAIEDLFVPLAIYNNKRGHDEEVLAIYKEPAWNNPVLLVVDAEGKSIIDRLSGQYTPYSVVQYIQKALIAWKEPIPPYLSLLEEELAAMRFGTKETYLSMFCFWSGEKHIGQIPGVVETEAGFMDGKEVVKVRYAPDLLEYKDLLSKAKSVSCADAAYTDDKGEANEATTLFKSGEIRSTSRYRVDREDKYYLRRSDLRFVPLTKLQKTRFNSMIARGLDPTSMLSPRQLSFLEKVDITSAQSQLDRTLETAGQLIGN